MEHTESRGDNTMLSKLALTFLIFYVIPSLVASWGIIILLKPDKEQQERLDNGESSLWTLRREFMNPLSPERLKELENAIGMPLRDMGLIAVGGRVVSAERPPTHAEIQRLLTVPWVRSASPDRTHVLFANSVPK